MKAVYKRKFCMALALVIEGAIAQIFLGLPSRVLAQSITIDGTLHPARPLTGANYRIRQADGRTVGRNLFHSFGRFDLNTGESATFESTPDIRNIITRVTGGTPSAIDGLIQTESRNVNLFLINPNGIVFGRNASLNIGGSFVASTANAIGFGNQGFFSASAPNDPSSLLTINPSALLFNQMNSGAIVNQSVAPAGVSPSGANAFGLRVPDGQNLLLVGGNVNLDGGSLNAFGGGIELGGLAKPGEVIFNADGSLFFPNKVGRSDIFFNNGAVDVAAGGGGRVAINARNLDMLNGSFIRAGIAPGLGTVGSQAGDITLNATGSIALSDLGRILNNVNFGATGNGGNIQIMTGSLLLTNGSGIQASTLAQGNAGNINIEARNKVALGGVAVDGFDSAILSRVENTARGNGGNIRITTGSLTLANGTQLGTDMKGEGSAGDIIIHARNTVSLDGQTAFTSAVRGQRARGNGGNIRVATGSLLLNHGSELISGTQGQGNAGSIVIRARDAILLDGETTDGQFTSGIVTSVLTTGA